MSQIFIFYIAILHVGILCRWWSNYNDVANIVSVPANNDNTNKPCMFTDMFTSLTSERPCLVGVRPGPTGTCNHWYNPANGLTMQIKPLIHRLSHRSFGCLSLLTCLSIFTTSATWLTNKSLETLLCSTTAKSVAFFAPSSFMSISWGAPGIKPTETAKIAARTTTTVFHIMFSLTTQSNGQENNSDGSSLKPPTYITASCALERLLSQPIGNRCSALYVMHGFFYAITLGYWYPVTVPVYYYLEKNKGKSEHS